jgi:hypothetical protein
VAGHDSRQFTLRGPLRVHSPATADSRPLVSPDLAGQAATSWSEANLFGLQTGPGDVLLTLNQGVAAMRPLEVSFGNGKLFLAPQIVMTGTPAQLMVPAGPVISGVELTDEFCDSWLKFIAPILSQATRSSGRFSLELDESRLPLSNLGAGELSGRFIVERGEVLPGPLFDEINGLISQIISGVGRNGPVDFLGSDRPLMVIPRQSVAFEMHEGRIYHEPMEFQGRGIVICTRGSVGLDQTLDVVAALTLSDDLTSRVPLLGKLKGQALEIPISGTLQRPRLDRRAIGGLAKQFGQNVLDMLLNNGLQNLLDRGE